METSNVTATTSSTRAIQSSQQQQPQKQQKQQQQQQQQKKINLNRYNIVQLCVSQRSKCGYCHGDRAFAINQEKQTSSKSYGVIFLKLSLDDYQTLIDHGWRRSGKHLYKFDNFSTCCPALSIRLNTTKFEMSRGQRKIWNKLESLHKRDPPQQQQQYQRKDVKHKKIDYRVDTTLIEEYKTLILSSLKQVLIRKYSMSFINLLSYYEKCPLKHSKNTSTPHQYCLFTAMCAAIAGSNKTRTIDKYELASETVQIMKKKCMKNVSVEAHEKSGQIHIFIPTSQLSPIEQMEAEDHVLNANENSVLSQILSKSPEQNKIKIITLPSHISAQDPKVHRLYTKYQAAIHGDTDPYLTSNQDEINSSFQSFVRFLGEAPFESNSHFGSFHQQYYLHDTLIAVGVVDILPRCLSSVYSFYDPIFSKFNLGTYTALKEIEYVQSCASPLIYYYLGFYIHSCVKMKYKGEFRPSELLCPQYAKWVDLKEAVSRIEIDSPLRQCCAFASPSSTQYNTLNANNKHHKHKKKRETIDALLLDFYGANQPNPENYQNHDGFKNCYQVKQINDYYRSLIDPLLDEFVEYVGHDISTRCIIQM